MMIADVSYLLSALIVGIWVARYLAPEQYGLLSYAQSFAALFSIFVSLGLEGIVLREIVKHENKAFTILTSAFWLKMAGTIFVFILLFISVRFTTNDSFTNLLIFIVASSFFCHPFTVVNIYFQAKVLGRYSALAKIASVIATSIFRISLILLKAPLIYFATVIVFDAFVLILAYLYYFSKLNTNLKLNMFCFDRAIALSLLRDSWPLIIGGSMLMIQTYIDQVMLKGFLGNQEVGFYSVAIKIVSLFGFIPTVLSNSLFPAIQTAKTTSDELYKNRLLNYYRLNFALFLVLAIPLFLFSEKIVVLLFGVAYEPAGVLLTLLTFKLFFTNMGVARGAFIICENMMMFSMLTMLAGTLVNVALNYLWIPHYGPKGAILATMISFLTTIFLLDFFHPKARKNLYLQLKSIMTFYKVNLQLSPQKNEEEPEL